MSPQGQSRSLPQLVAIWLDPVVLPVVPAPAPPVVVPAAPPTVPPEPLPPEDEPPVEEATPPPVDDPAVPVLDALVDDDVPEVPVVPITDWSQTEL
jgi:hypothetical protein